MSLLTVPGVLVRPGEQRWSDRWQNGIAFSPESCDVPLSFTVGVEDLPYWWECADTDGESPQAAFESENGAADGTKAIGDRPARVEVDALTLWAGDKCRPGGEDERAEAVARATSKLEALTPTAIERELWTGAMAALAGYPNPAFDNTGLATQVGGGAPLGFVTALGEIEQAIADTMPLTGTAIIHAQPRVVTAWKHADLVEAAPGNTHLVTACGTIVVPERGASGTAPAPLTTHATYSYSWVYVTGMVSVFLGDPIPPVVEESVVRTTNDLEVRVERDYLAAFSPCGLLAARVALCDPYCLGGS